MNSFDTDNAILKPNPVNCSLFAMLDIYAWVYKIETGGVFVYSAERCSIQAKHDEDESELTEEPALPELSVNGNGKRAALSRDR